MEHFKMLTLYYQVTLDTMATLITLYTGLAITQNFGTGNARQKWQLAHRFAFVWVTLGWAYHAEDMLMNPGLHGLTKSNLILHTGLVVLYTIACIRIMMYQRVTHDDVYMNGDLSTGPFQP